MSSNNEQAQEEAMTALFHAAVLGRTDVVKMAFSSLESCFEGQSDSKER